MNQCAQGPWVFHWGRFDFCRKFAEIFNEGMFITGVKDTGDKLLPSINDSSGKFIASVNVLCILYTITGFIRGILRGVRYAKSLRVLFLHRLSPSWTTLVLYSRAVFIFNEPTKYLTNSSESVQMLLAKNHTNAWARRHVTRGLVCVKLCFHRGKKCIIALGVFYVAFRSTYARCHVGYACCLMPRTVQTQQSEDNGICTYTVSVFVAKLQRDLWLQFYYSSNCFDLYPWCLCFTNFAKVVNPGERFVAGIVVAGKGTNLTNFFATVRKKCLKLDILRLRRNKWAEVKIPWHCCFTFMCSSTKDRIYFCSTWEHLINPNYILGHIAYKLCMSIFSFGNNKNESIFIICLEFMVCTMYIST